MSSRVFAELAAATLLLALSACVRISATSLAPNAGRYNPDSVRVLAVQQPATYTELAILRTHRFLVSDHKVLDALRKRAAQLGANGLLLINTPGSGTQSHSGVGVIVTGGDAGDVIVGNSQTKIDAFERAIAIRFTLDDAARDDAQ